MKPIFSGNAYQSALRFALEMHRGQVYPAGNGIPYICHPALVCSVVMAALRAEPVEDPDLAVQCALLHDTLEDTRAAYADLECEFGTAVAEGVQALTKDHALPKDERLPDSLCRIRLQPREVAMVKLADRICNLGRPPLDWTDVRRTAYLAGALAIHRVLGCSSLFLAGMLDRRIEFYLNNFCAKM